MMEDESIQNGECRCDGCDKAFGSQEALDAHNAAKHKHGKHISRATRTFSSGKIIIMVLASIIVIAIAIFGIFSFIGNATSNTQSQNNLDNSDYKNSQIVNVKVSGASYILEPSVLKKDVPVRMIFDMKTVTGCAQSVVIPSFGVRKFVSPASNEITFIPDKVGTFGIACSMNMYRGSFTVE